MGGLSFPNFVTVLLLPVFILPGYAGLKVRQYVARREEEGYSRLDTVAYSWVISTVSITLLYGIVFLFTDDLSLIPEIVRVDEVEIEGAMQVPPSSETGLRLERLILGYAIHFVISVLIGTVYGAFAYNFLDEVRVTAGDTNRKLMLDQIAPGRDVDIRTKTGELLRGNAGRNRDTADEAGLLLSSPKRLVDSSEGEIIVKHDLGMYIYIDAEDISRISVVDEEEPENLDPEATYEKPDRLQMFVTTLLHGMWPEEIIETLREQQSHLSSFIGVTSGSFGAFLMGIWLVHSHLLSSSAGELVLDRLIILAGIFVLFTLVCTVGFVCLTFDGIEWWWPVAALALAAGYSVLWSFAVSLRGYLGTVSLLTAGFMIGCIGVYATTIKRKKSGPITVIAILLLALVLTPVDGPALLSRTFMSLLLIILATVLVFYEIIQGGPSRRNVWAKKLQPPLIMVISSITVLSLIQVPGVLTESRPSILFLMFPVFGGIVAIYREYQITIEKPVLPKPSGRWYSLLVAIIPFFDG